MKKCFLLLFIFSIFFNSQAQIKIGDNLPSFTLKNIINKDVSSETFQNKYYLIDFWASWCRPCRMENPNVVAAYQKFKDKGFTVLGISMDSNKEAWLNAIKQDQLTWTQVSDLKGWSNEVGQLYGVGSIPQNFLIGPDGIIIAKELRGSALEQKLSELFNK